MLVSFHSSYFHVRTWTVVVVVGIWYCMAFSIVVVVAYRDVMMSSSQRCLGPFQTRRIRLGYKVKNFS